MHTKLAIGTVQFGLDYGISNTLGKVSLDEIDKIFDYAISKNVSCIDTAQAYGDSEAVLGLFTEKYPLVIITKLKADIGSGDNIISAFNSSLSKLKVKFIYGLLYHDFQSFLNNTGSFEIIKNLKKEGAVKKIGFSLYHPQELEYLLENKIEFDLIQIPYSIFDRRFEPYFETLNQIGVEIHVRSVFLQGIIFMEQNKLSDFFTDFKTKLDLFHAKCDKLQVSSGHAALQFVAANRFIDKIVLGIQSLEHLKINMDWLGRGLGTDNSYFDELKEENLDFIIPSNWKL